MSCESWISFGRSARVVSLMSLVGLASLNVASAAPPYAEEWFLPAPPEDVEVDASGRVWVSCEDDSVRVFAPTGGQLLFAFGGRGTGEGEFLTPDGIAFDPGGDVYICDYEGARVQKFTSEGEFILSWPIPSDRSDHVAVDAAGEVYVTGYSNLQVHKYSSIGDPIVDWTSASGERTAGVVVADGVVSVVLWTVPDIEQYDSAGNYLRTLPASTLNGLDIEVDSSSQFWVANFNGYTVNVLSADGDLVDVLGSPGSGPGEFFAPSGVALGLDGSVYVADQGNVRIQRFGDAVADAPEVLEAPVSGVALRSIAPNPARSVVDVVYSSAGADRVELTVLDVTGRSVARLEDGLVDPGTHRIEWTLQEDDGSSLAAGVYFVRLAAGGQASTQRLVIIR